LVKIMIVLWPLIFFIKNILVRNMGKVFYWLERCTKKLSRIDRNVLDLVLGSGYIGI
jgi:hypothetical protein